MTDEPTRTLPTEAEVAEVIIQYETGGLCHYGRTCGTCDCHLWAMTPEQQRESWAMERDRARAVLALFGNRPTAAQVKAEALREHARRVKRIMRAGLVNRATVLADLEDYAGRYDREADR